MSFKFLDWQEWNILIMLLREKGRERESGGGGGGRQTHNHINYKKKEMVKRNASLEHV